MRLRAQGWRGGRRLAVALAIGMVTTSGSAAQSRGTRFEITAVADTTFQFRAGEVKWLRDQLGGLVVDPRKRDALVARFRVISVDRGEVTALITGQVTAISTDHVVVVTEPARPLMRERLFWVGMLFGTVIGFGAGLVR